MNGPDFAQRQTGVAEGEGEEVFCGEAFKGNVFLDYGGNIEGCVWQTD